MTLSLSSDYVRFVFLKKFAMFLDLVLLEENTVKFFGKEVSEKCLRVSRLVSHERNGDLCALCCV